MTTKMAGLRNFAEKQFTSLEARIVLEASTGTSVITDELMKSEKRNRGLIIRTACELSRANYLEDIRDMKNIINKYERPNLLNRVCKHCRKLHLQARRNVSKSCGDSDQILYR